MKHEIFKKDCPVLMLVSITETGYVVSSNPREAMLLNSEEEANDVIQHIPGTDSSLWGSRPRRPK